MCSSKYYSDGYIYVVDTKEVKKWVSTELRQFSEKRGGELGINHKDLTQGGFVWLHYTKIPNKMLYSSFLKLDFFT